MHAHSLTTDYRLNVRVSMMIPNHRHHPNHRILAYRWIWLVLVHRPSHHQLSFGFANLSKVYKRIGD